MISEATEILDFLRRETTLSDGDIAELADNFDAFGPVIKELIQEIKGVSESRLEMTRIDTRIASLNYEIFSTYMSVHTNAIALSGTKASLLLAGKDIPEDIRNDVEAILEKYLLIKF